MLSFKSLKARLVRQCSVNGSGPHAFEAQSKAIIFGIIRVAIDEIDDVVTDGVSIE